MYVMLLGFHIDYVTEQCPRQQYGLVQSVSMSQYHTGVQLTKYCELS